MKFIWFGSILLSIIRFANSFESVTENLDSNSFKTSQFFTSCKSLNASYFNLNRNLAAIQHHHATAHSYNSGRGDRSDRSQRHYSRDRYQRSKVITRTNNHAQKVSNSPPTKKRLDNNWKSPFNSHAVNATSEKNDSEAYDRIKSIFGQHYEVMTINLYLEINHFRNFNDYLHNESSSTATYTPIDIHPPHVLFDQTLNKTRLTWCHHNGNPLSAAVELENDNNRLWKSLRDKRIVFMGDSVVRFQYLDFVYFLKYKEWNVRHHELVNIHSFRHDWSAF